MLTEQYFFIDLIDLKDEDAIFSFNIYIYEPHSQKYKVELSANSPFDSTVRDRYKMLLSKGARLAISYKQKKAFLSQLEIQAESIKSLKSISGTFEEERRIAAKKKIQEEIFHLGHAFKKAIKTDDFTDVIKRARDEIFTLPANFNQTLSNVLAMNDSLLVGDCLHNRVISICYFVAKLDHMDKPEDLADLLHAAFIYDIGLSQVSFNYQTIPASKLNQKAKEEFENHPGLSMHLIRKTKINCSLRAKKYVQDHHERYAGSGYPSAKRDPFIDQIGQILGLVDFVVHYSSGKITGQKVPMDEVISNIKNKLTMSGLELDFHHDIVGTFYALCFRSSGVNTEEAAA